MGSPLHCPPLNNGNMPPGPETSIPRICVQCGTPNPYVVYNGNSKEKPNCITCMQPNEVGLYAMCGNVWEWTLKKSESQGGPSVMGGSFFEDADHVKVYSRKEFPQSLRRQDIGFMVVVNTNQ